ncbi:hypothetical protein Cal6303_4895 [Calothrix sp. PCC 6303]|nr:hypothetical protein Cal6303_4895 [Calothrix sp. PCC 6303]
MSRLYLYYQLVKLIIIAIPSYKKSKAEIIQFSAQYEKPKDRKFQF